MRKSKIGAHARRVSKIVSLLQKELKSLKRKSNHNSFSTYGSWGRGSSKSVRHVHKGSWANISKYVRKIPLLHVFCDIFICKILLPYFLFGIDFHYCFVKHLLWLFSCLSNVLQSFLYGIIDWIVQNIPPRNGGCQIGRHVRNGGRRMCVCAYEGGGGQILSFSCVRT